MRNSPQMPYPSFIAKLQKAQCTLIGRLDKCVVIGQQLQACLGVRSLIITDKFQHTNRTQLGLFFSLKITLWNGKFAELFKLKQQHYTLKNDVEVLIIVLSLYYFNIETLL